MNGSQISKRDSNRPPDESGDDRFEAQDCNEKWPHVGDVGPGPGPSSLGTPSRQPNTDKADGDGHKGDASEHRGDDGAKGGSDAIDQEQQREPDQQDRQYGDDDQANHEQ